MNTLDIIIVVLTGLFLVRGLMRGFIKEIASILGILLGIGLGYNYQKGLADVATRLGIAQGPGLGLGCFLLIFLSTYVSVRLIAWLFTHMLGSGTLGMVNRLLGGGIATLKASIVVCVGVALLSFVLPGRSALLKESVIAPYALKLYGAVSSRITPDMYKNWKRKFQSSPPSEGKKDSNRNPT